MLRTFIDDRRSRMHPRTTSSRYKMPRSAFGVRVIGRRELDVLLDSAEVPDDDRSSLFVALDEEPSAPSGIAVERLHDRISERRRSAGLHHAISWRFHVAVFGPDGVDVRGLQSLPHAVLFNRKGACEVPALEGLVTSWGQWSTFAPYHGLGTTTVAGTRLQADGLLTTVHADEAVLADPVVRARINTPRTDD